MKKTILPRPWLAKIERVALALLALSLPTQGQQAPPFERTEQRTPCADYDALKKPLFGDLHVHTSYSFDSYISSQRNDPWDAYRYARGEPITLPGAEAEQTVTARIGRPLDFAAVTDHAEFLGQIHVCTMDPGKAGYWWPHCIMTRSSNLWVQLLAANWWTDLGGQLDNEPAKSFACNLSDCDEGGAALWRNTQQAAEDNYDRSSACSFTSFVAYEYTEAFDQNNMHRNVIFRNEKVVETPVSVYDTGKESFPALWEQLRKRCTDLDTGCEVIAIPHNSNLSGGLMFRDPQSKQELEDRLFFEPVVEITQHKGASECRFDRLAGRGLLTEDELCDYEQVVSDNLNMLGSVNGELRTERASAVPLEDFGARNMVRNALKDGLMLEQRDGANPFVMGFIGSTDSHSAAPGSAEENNFVGHLGRRDAEYRNVQDHFFSNPGGHAVVWAEENSRDAIYAAIKRRETYATSGTRPVVRFFGGSEVAENLCEADDMIARAYRQGVPMGGEFSGSPGAASPRFLVSAQKDPGDANYPGTDLQRLQIIKGWVDAGGQTHEKVYDVAGDKNNGAGVDPDNCATVGRGAGQLCAVWQDPDFEADRSAFYYLRVVENPSCRWSTLHCQAAGVNPFATDCAARADAASERARDSLGASGDVYGKCCLDPGQQPFYSPVQQERAWTSPIWYHPNR